MDGSSYALKDRLLTQLVEKNQEYRIVVPPEGIPMILHNYHRAKGIHQHLCLTVTCRKIFKFYTWPNMYTDILEYVKKCKECIKYQRQQGGSFYFKNFHERQLPAPENRRPPDPYHEEYEYDHMGGVSMLNQMFHEDPVFDIYNRW